MINWPSLKVFSIINGGGRNTSVDVFRSMAIIAVVIYHFNITLPYGYLGVDLFFVISGLLIGGLLSKQFVGNQSISFLRFFLSRGFKIWPSYYFFIGLGTVIAYFFYRDLDPSQIIPLWDMKRYLLFYQNFTGLPFHWSFDHVWSLCVEEHFYILLPILYIFVQRNFSGERMLFVFVSLVIGLGILCKILALYFTTGKDTYSATYNRVDALAWGVLLSLILNFRPKWLANARTRRRLIWLGGFLFVVNLAIHILFDHKFHQKIIFHSVLPVAFFCILAGTYFIDFSRFRVLRFIAYYSYNWYLWHPIFVLFISHWFGVNFIGLLLYLISTFIMALMTTVFIEEPMMAKREVVLNRLYGKC